MTDEDGYFCESVAATYDEGSDRMLDPAVVEPTVDFLEELAGDGRALELGGIDEYDVANQGLISHHFEVRDGKVEKSSGPFRYVWPSELDLMAELAGMRLSERWSRWGREPFTSDSRQHVSVWEKPT